MGIHEISLPVCPDPEWTASVWFHSSSSTLYLSRSEETKSISWTDSYKRIQALSSFTIIWLFGSFAPIWKQASYFTAWRTVRLSAERQVVPPFIPAQLTVTCQAFSTNCFQQFPCTCGFSIAYHLGMLQHEMKKIKIAFAAFPLSDSESFHNTFLFLKHLKTVDAGVLMSKQDTTALLYLFSLAEWCYMHVQKHDTYFYKQEKLRPLC